MRSKLTPSAISMKDVTKTGTMLELQGDKVLAVYNSETLVLTVVRVMDADSSHLLLVDRETKQRDEWPLLQEVADMLVPFTDPKLPGVKWRFDLNAPVAQC